MEAEIAEKTEKQNVYDIVTLKIIEQMEQGRVPWRKPWIDAGLPRNLASGKEYKGINVWLLGMLGYSQNLFLTFKQVGQLGGKVTKGEKSHIIVYWNWKEVEHRETKKMVKMPFLRYYKVFNISQCEGIPKNKVPGRGRPNDAIAACEAIVRCMPNSPAIQHVEQKAYYDRKKDIVNVPIIDHFIDSPHYYATLFHELVHSTGHTSRLNRKELIESESFGSDLYSMEELTAEIGACYLKSEAGILTEDLENSAAYIYNWIEVLKNDHRFIIFACSAAQKAVDYILNLNQDIEEKEPSIAEIGVDLPF